MDIKNSVFYNLSSMDVNEHVEEKDNGKTKLKYLSWAWAWQVVKLQYPTASYKVIKFDNRPYLFDPLTGYMIFTEVTIEGETIEMWLPVMNSNNKTMMDKPYKYSTKYGESTVEPATMFDINKTIMRCLVKNLAMFGLGLYIYAGEDLPEIPDETPKIKIISADQVTRLHTIAKGHREVAKAIISKYGYESSKDIKTTDYEKICKEIEQTILGGA